MTLRVADDLPHWSTRGRVHEVILRLRLASVTEDDRFEFRLNGQVLPQTCLRRINETYRMKAPRFRTGSCYWFVFRPPPEQWPVQGDNRIEVTLLERAADTIPEVVLRDVELEICYLMGRAFHRGFVDPDLGAYNCGNT